LLRKTPKLNEVEPNAYKIPRQVARQLATPWGEEVHFFIAQKKTAGKGTVPFTRRNTPPAVSVFYLLLSVKSFSCTPITSVNFVVSKCV
jgi:hypothetical protein